MVVHSAEKWVVSMAAMLVAPSADKMVLSMVERRAVWMVEK